VSGLGYVTTRDFISFLRNATVDDAGTPNPVARVKRALCHGYSISGQYLRDFVYQGFNEDEQGRKVCDGMMVHSAGGQKAALNYRFASDPNSTPFRSQHADRGAPETNFPRTYTMRTDPLSGATDGLLKRPATDPLIMHVNSSTEYWERRGSLLDTDENGFTDLVESPNVRRYLVARPPSRAFGPPFRSFPPPCRRPARPPPRPPCPRPAAPNPQRSRRSRRPNGRPRVTHRRPRARPPRARRRRKATAAKNAPKAKKAAKAQEAGGPREGTKTATVVAMLQRKNGATLPEIMKAMCWQKHTVRGFMAGAMKKAGYTVESFKPEGGERTYRLPAK